MPRYNIGELDNLSVVDMMQMTLDGGAHDKETFRNRMASFADNLAFVESDRRNISAKGYEDKPDHARGIYQFKPSEFETTKQRASNFYRRVHGLPQIGDRDANNKFILNKEENAKIEAAVDRRFPWRKINNEDIMSMSEDQQKEVMYVNVFESKGTDPLIRSYVNNPSTDNFINLYQVGHYKGANLDETKVAKKMSGVFGWMKKTYNDFESRLENIPNDPRAVETLAGRPIREAEERALRQRARKN
jgi:hypothetical protein|tara:strand:+ start:114 stop:851 length:738 start_codon:yes stop_codon:yes gene_type:complete